MLVVGRAETPVEIAEAVAHLEQQQQLAIGGGVIDAHPITIAIVARLAGLRIARRGGGEPPRTPASVLGQPLAKAVQIAGRGQVETMPAAEKKKLVDGELGLTMDPSLLRGATADLLIKNRSEIFSSNVLSQKDLAQLHESTAIVSFLHDFFSHSWRTARLDQWAALLLYLNVRAAVVAKSPFMCIAPKSRIETTAG